jgi:hypothetical protein
LPWRCLQKWTFQFRFKTSLCYSRHDLATPFNWPLLASMAIWLYSPIVVYIRPTRSIGSILFQ